MIEKRFWPGALAQFGNADGLRITRFALGQHDVTGRVLAVREDSLVIEWPQSFVTVAVTNAGPPTSSTSFDWPS